MLKGLWKLTWVEIKIFLREPMGVIGTVGIPVVLFLLLGRMAEGGVRPEASGAREWFDVRLPVFAAIFIAIGAVLSLVAVISIYREGGILKRLRATPLRPVTILGAHVLVKLLLTATTLGLLVLAGKRFYPGGLEVDLPGFAAALLLGTLSILALGFVIASLVPTARFAQPIGSALLYPMLAISGLFLPVENLPPLWRGVANALPVTHAVALLEGIWTGGAWSAQWLHVGALALNFALCTWIASRVFRWE
ncbi:MAG: ABC transporter permease [Acidobacteriota bacterium]|nr:ABC transporter permease [Acidobacteriota bacterium]